MVKEIIAIWAEDQHRLIGQNGRLPWHLPKELQHFKQATLNQALVMGRVTFDGMNRRVLPQRQTLILSHQIDLNLDGVETFSSPEAVLAWFHQQDKDLYVVGGASVYKAFEPYYDRLVVTRVEGEFEGDTYFPSIAWSSFEAIAEQSYEADEQNSHRFTVTTYRKKKEDWPMQRSLFGVFSAFLCGICFLAAIPAFQKKRYGLGIFFLLNAFTNIVVTIHAFYGTLF